MKNVKALFLGLVLMCSLFALSAHAQVLRTNADCGTRLNAEQLLKINSENHSMAELKTMGYPNAMDTIDAYHSLQSPMPQHVAYELRTGQVIEKTLDHNELFNSHFSHLNRNGYDGYATVALSAGSKVLCYAGVQNYGDKAMEGVKYILRCCNPSNGPNFETVKTRVETITDYRSTSTGVYVVPGPSQVVTNDHFSEMTRVVGVPNTEWNFQGIRSVESQRIAGVASVYQVAVQKVAVTNTANNQTNTTTTNNQTNNSNYTTNNQTNIATTNNTTSVVCPVVPVTIPPNPRPGPPADVCPPPPTTIPVTPVPVVPPPTAEPSPPNPWPGPPSDHASGNAS